MSESVCRKCGKPIERYEQSPGKFHWIHKSAGGSRAQDIYDSEHRPSPGGKS